MTTIRHITPRRARPAPALAGLLLGAILLPTIGGCNNPAERSDAYNRRNRTAQFDREFAAGAEREPTPRLLHAMARLFAAQGRDDRARHILERLIDEHPRFLPAYNELAELHMRHHRVDRAAEMLAAGLELAPEDPVLLNNLGMCRMLQEEYAEALALFRKAQTAAPEDARYIANEAAALGMLGRFQQAQDTYERILPPADAQSNLDVLRDARQQQSDASPDRAGQGSAPTARAEAAPASSE